MTKKATTVVVIIVGVICILQAGCRTMTFAQVVEPILNAKSIVHDLTIGSDEPGPIMHEIVVGSRIRRTISNMPTVVQVLDLDSGKMLILDSEGKTATHVDIQGMVQDETKVYIEFLRQAIRQMQNDQVEKIGEQLIEGQKVIGFIGKGQNKKVTIWADPTTGHPIQIELQIGQTYAIMKNLEFDVPVDDALVSMDVPAGYQFQETTLDLSEPSEQEFVESLRIWAEIIRTGAFPEAIGIENAVKEMPTLVQKLTQMQLSEEEKTQIGIKFARGMLFHQMLDNRGGDWHYAGAGVKLGDTQTAIFWYQPQDSAPYRIIYGDLSIKDAAPDDLPK